MIPRFERAKLIDLPAGVLAFRKSGRFSNTSTENPLLARYKANTGPESPPPITVILSKQLLVVIKPGILVFQQIPRLRDRNYIMEPEQHELHPAPSNLR